MNALALLALVVPLLGVAGIFTNLRAWRRVLFDYHDEADRKLAENAQRAKALAKAAATYNVESHDQRGGLTAGEVVAPRRRPTGRSLYSLASGGLDLPPIPDDFAAPADGPWPEQPVEVRRERWRELGRARDPWHQGQRAWADGASLADDPYTEDSADSDRWRRGYAGVH